MQILHHMRKERSGLAYTCLEHCKFEAQLGHEVAVKAPGGDWLFGQMDKPDVHVISSQLDMSAYHDGKPKFLVCHGEPLSSVGNGVSFKAIVDMASQLDALICMREQEQDIWNTVKRTYYVPKGVDLQAFTPLEHVERLEGEPAVLIYENPRGQRNALYAIIAMKHVWRKFPKARLHIFNVSDKKMHDTFSAFIKQAKLWPFVRTLSGPVPHDKVPWLLNRADIVISCLFPLFARSVESFACNKPLICPGYREHGYRYMCDLQPESMSDAIMKAWEERGKYNWRQWAEKHHDALESSRQMVEIYQKYL